MIISTSRLCYQYVEPAIDLSAYDRAAFLYQRMKDYCIAPVRYFAPDQCRSELKMDANDRPDLAAFLYQRVT
jgi:hypothetical protein